jgi:L-ascorbate metabolism protein UlaG (beta-lactamase superfamily)
MSLTYLGHSCFEIQTKGKKILIDPFLVQVPEYNSEGVTDILVTHGHGDHLGSAIEISKKTGATITAVFELANYCIRKGAHAQGIGLGSWINFDWGRVIAVPAFHSSSAVDNSLDEPVYTGCPCGFVIELSTHTIYHAGDTSLSSEMKVIGELYSPDVAMLPIGGTYTMDIEHAAIAADWLDVSAIIPMHYNTFPPISVNIDEFEQVIRNKGKIPLVMNINQRFDAQ